jgi:predicted PurR-regulated permease PerM
VAQIADNRFSNVLFYAAVLAPAYFVFRIFLPFFTPLGWAAVFAVISHSWNERLARKWGATGSALALTTGVTLILIVPVLLISGLFVREGIAAAHDIQVAVGAGQYGWVGRAWDWIMARVAAEGMTADLPGLLREGASRAGQYLATELGAVVRNIVVFLFELFVTLFALFYLLRDSRSILQRFRDVLPFEPAMRDRMLLEARELVFASVTTSLAIAGVQGILCGSAFAVVGLESALFWGVVMGFLSLLPLVGAWPVWVPAAIYLFSTGRWGRAIIVIVICGAVGASVDNVLRPVMLGGRASLNGLLVFISVLGGIAVFGVLGVVLGPIVVATAVGILDAYAGNGGPANAVSAADG